MFKYLDLGVRKLVENVFNVSMETHLGESIHFFIYDVVKILVLLSVMIFIISYLRSFFQPERTKKILTHFSGIKGNIIASLLGIVTPFCSCSSVPLFIAFVEAGIPVGVTFSFLITSPIVNEAAFIILLGTFGWKIAVIYVFLGVVIGVIGGIIIGSLKPERYVEEYVFKLKAGNLGDIQQTFRDRIDFAFEQVKEILQRIWLFLLIGIGLGAAIHGWAPADLLAKYAGPNNPIAVLVGVVIGIPLYSNALGTIPIAEALIGKGVGLGTALSFMMAVTALSLPELIILRKVVKPRLLIYFVAITGAGIIVVGYIFNMIYHLI